MIFPFNDMGFHFEPCRGIMRGMPLVTGDVLLRERLEKALIKAAPGFVRAVAKAKEERADYVLLPFQSFRSEPDLFFRAVQYASLEGVPILIVPEDHEDREML
jgi:hypothetical protein